MSQFSVSQSPSRFLLNGQGGPRYALPPSSGVGFAEGLLFGIAGGAVLAIPVALRSSGTLSQSFVLWLGAAGLNGMLLGLLAAALRVSRPLPSRSPALLLGLGFALGPLSQLGSALHSGTNHRPLGAATFAVAAGIVVALAWALASRTWLSLRAHARRRRNYGYVLLALGSVISLVSLLPTLWSWMRHFAELGLLSSAVVDGLLGLALAMFGGFARFPKKLESSARTAGPLAFGVCALSFAVALQALPVAALLRQVSLLWAWLG